MSQLQKVAYLSLASLLLSSFQCCTLLYFWMCSSFRFAVCSFLVCKNNMPVYMLLLLTVYFTSA